MRYLAFDFGDGTTTAAYYEEGKDEPQELPILPGTKEIISILGFRNGGEPGIGSNVVEGLYDQRVEHWKTRPTDFDNKTEKKKYMIVFMQEVYKNFLEINPAFKNDTKIIIGVPSDWSRRDMEQYKEIAKQAGLQNVLVLRESQAAILYARKYLRGSNGQSMSSEAINSGVLLIDCGSSTTDFTYMKGLDVFKHRGFDLGAKYIDRLFLLAAIENQKSKNRGNCDNDNCERCSQKCFFDIMSSRRQDDTQTTLSYESRIYFKEKYFSNCGSLRETRAQKTSLVVDKKEWDFVFGQDYHITEKYINSILDDTTGLYSFTIPHYKAEANSWRGHFRNMLRNVKDDLNIDPASTTIIVTGGATRMWFIEEDIKNVFGDEQECFFGDDNARSFSVVRGLAWAGYAKDKVEKTFSSVIKSLENGSARDAVRNYVRDSIFSPVAQRVATKVRDKICSELSSCSSSVNTLRKVIDRLSDLTVSEMNDFISNATIDITPILQLSTISSETKKMHDEFSKVGIQFTQKISCPLAWSWSQVGFNIGYLDGALISDVSSSGDEIFFIRDRTFSIVKDNIRSQLTSYKVMELFEKEGINGLPSDVSAFVERCTDKVISYKEKEMRALLSDLK